MENAQNMEIFKDIKGYPDYQISTQGRVWSIRKQKYMKPQINNMGYYQLNMFATNGKVKKELIHRLVALTFIDNPNNYPQVHHINHNPQDNRVENLQWVTGKQNCRDTKANKKVSQFDKDGNLIKTFSSMTEAAEAVGGNYQGLYMSFYRNTKYYKGFFWEKEA